MTPSVTPAAPLRAFVEELAGAGVRDAVVCPGSRSTPLALALRAHGEIRVLVHLDERAAGYFALGLAKASRHPVALLATSGTAVVNFAPAVAEAHAGRVPLVVLTADRPPELRGRGANQTLDQGHLYGRHAKWFSELPVPEDEPASVASIRSVAARAVETAIEAPAGPVQVNWPFREPLVPVGSLAPGASRRQMVVVRPVLLPSVSTLDELGHRVRRAERPLLVVGPFDRPGGAEAIAALAASLDAPILADGLANLRVGPHDRRRVIAHHDALLRVAAFRDARRPDLVLRFGATPTSTALLGFLAETRAEQVVVDEGGWNEPTLLPGTLVHADPVALALALAERMPAVRSTGWVEDWLAADRAAEAAVGATLAAFDEPFEGSVFAELEGRLPDGTILVAGNSMPVRDLDAFLPAAGGVLRCLGNRGVSGIDGVVSTALGAAAADAGPVLAVVGDLSFVHDLNALVAARLHRLSATIVVIDNDGGGIFSFLPQATTHDVEAGLPAHFEELFATAHGTDVLAVARALGAEVADLIAGEVGKAIAASVGRPGVRVLRLRTTRRRNVELHRAVVAAVAAAIDGGRPAGG